MPISIVFYSLFPSEKILSDLKKQLCNYCASFKQVKGKICCDNFRQFYSLSVMFLRHNFSIITIDSAFLPDI